MYLEIIMPYLDGISGGDHRVPISEMGQHFCHYDFCRCDPIWWWDEELQTRIYHHNSYSREEHEDLGFATVGFLPLPLYS